MLKCDYCGKMIQDNIARKIEEQGKQVILCYGCGKIIPNLAMYKMMKKYEIPLI